MCIALLIATMATSIVPMMPVAACSNRCGGNIVTNGGFESPAVTITNGWNIYHSIPGWTVQWMPQDPSWYVYNGVNYTRPAQATQAYFEIQTDAPITGTEIPSGWVAAEGSQWTELASDWFGPGSLIPMTPSNVRISQVLATTPCQTYTLSFSFSPRPGFDSNVMQVTWGGKVVATISVSGLGNTGTVWAYYTYTLKATSSHTTLSFADTGQVGSYGDFLDNVSVSVPCSTGFFGGW